VVIARNIESDPLLDGCAGAVVEVLVGGMVLTCALAPQVESDRRTPTKSGQEFFLVMT
jgi:hypothetical protein